ncbi:MAG: cytochrome b, partial [Gammaproteobacteria bacterium]
MPTLKYTRTAMWLHWLIAGLVFTLFALGWYMVDLPKGPDRGASFALHKSLGLTVFLLMLWRLGWRLRHAAPPLPDTVPHWQATVARAVHASFYLLLLLQPITGYLSSSYSGYDTALFGIALPQWGHHNPPLNELFTEIHVLNSMILLGLVLAHLAGAF